MLLEPDLPRTIPTKYEEFKSYIEKIDELDEMFDVILVDGRARVQCAEFIVPYLNEGAMVMVHDFWRRPQYYSLLNLYREVASIAYGQSVVILQIK